MSNHSFFKITPTLLSAIADDTDCKIENAKFIDGILIKGAGPLEDTDKDCISFIDNPKYVKYLADTKAAAVFCSPKLLDKIPNHITALVNNQPYKAYAKTLSMLYPTAGKPEPITGETGISKNAYISKEVTLEDDVLIEAGCIIGQGASIGAGSQILANAVIGKNVKIGRNSTIGSNACVSHSFVGDDVIIHTGVKIGQDGFGFAMGPGGHEKVAQIGRVIIQDKVEIGANTTIDRGSNRDTIIGEGTKIDNLVQIGHNVVIGQHCIIVGLAGIAGSATLGDYVVVAGQAGIVGHITIGSGAQIGGGSGVNFDLKPGEKVIGYPAQPFKQWVKMNMMLKSMMANKKKDRDSK
ncbi:MAG: UDP-3-O-(3-hydroxymyristoyl)glucosamine N-acyltransferase [Rhizobiales bacterium]|nr:UDP-3-O-(3-hydroxymyristoyl)glucosamine N-acyltransferase [Hyphomicrobiales bacterium]